MSLGGWELTADHDFVVALDLLSVIQLLFESVNSNCVRVDKGDLLNDFFGFVELMLYGQEAWWLQGVFVDVVC